ncbi:MAG TPA: class I SAM-dependent methyltransferase, partial [Polyangia bacterium]
MKSLPRVTLRKRLSRTIRGGHPWIYRDALAGTPPLADGALVLVAGGDGRPLGRGFWDMRSPIAVRILCGADEVDVGGEVGRRIAAALARRLAAIDRTETTAFRWIHGEADALPGVHADVYGRALSFRCDGGGARAFYRDLPDRLRAAARTAGLPLDAVVERRPRGDGADEGARAVFGALPDGEIEIRENGLLFGADLRRGQKGGLFLDQRDNRARVRELARDRRVLNLFGYTGGFSIYAAAGGARETITVDVAAPAIAAARRNFERNHLTID